MIFGTHEFMQSTTNQPGKLSCLAACFWSSASSGFGLLTTSGTLAPRLPCWRCFPTPYPIPSMGRTVYLPRWMVDFFGKWEKYTSHMDGYGWILLQLKKWAHISDIEDFCAFFHAPETSAQSKFCRKYRASLHAGACTIPRGICWQARTSCVLKEFCFDITCAKVKTPYLGDGHPTFNRESLQWVCKPLWLGWWPSPGIWN